MLLGFYIALHEALYTTGDRVSVWGAALGLIFGPVYWRRLDAQRDQEKAEEKKAKDSTSSAKAQGLADLLDGLEWLREQGQERTERSERPGGDGGTAPKKEGS